jgi:prolipoprotein diacylglyceryltransferase
MDGESFFGTVITLVVGAAIFVALQGNDPTWLIDLIPSIAVVALLIAVALAVLS